MLSSVCLNKTKVASSGFRGRYTFRDKLLINLALFTLHHLTQQFLPNAAMAAVLNTLTGHFISYTLLVPAGTSFVSSPNSAHSPVTFDINNAFSFKKKICQSACIFLDEIQEAGLPIAACSMCDLNT